MNLYWSTSLSHRNSAESSVVHALGRLLELKLKTAPPPACRLPPSCLR